MSVSDTIPTTRIIRYSVNHSIFLCEFEASGMFNSWKPFYTLKTLCVAEKAVQRVVCHRDGKGMGACNESFENAMQQTFIMSQDSDIQLQ